MKTSDAMKRYLESDTCKKIMAETEKRIIRELPVKMSNLNTISGGNNCYFNINSKCTNPKVTRGLASESGRDWDSLQGCTFTQDGAQSLCSEYFFEHIYKETKLQEKTDGLMKCRHPYSRCRFIIGKNKKYRKPPADRKCGVAEPVCKSITDAQGRVTKSGEQS